MEDVKKISLNKKNILLVAAAVIILAIVAITVCVVLGKGRNSSKKLESSLKKMGTDFYENFYYVQIANSSEGAEALSKWTDIGVKVNLDTLSRYEEGKYEKEVAKFKNKKTKKECDKVNTRAVIYPESPYGKKDYKVEIELDCGFKEDK